MPFLMIFNYNINELKIWKNYLVYDSISIHVDPLKLFCNGSNIFVKYISGEEEKIANIIGTNDQSCPKDRINNLNKNIEQKKYYSTEISFYKGKISILIAIIVFLVIPSASILYFYIIKKRRRI